MNKRGAYFFVIDAIIAGTVLIAGLMFIFSSYTMVPQSEPSFRMTNDFMKYLGDTKVREIYGAPIEKMILDGNITRQDNTLVEQMLEFYYLNKTDQLYNFTKAVTDQTIPGERSIIIFVNQTMVFNRSVSAPAATKLMISAKKVAFQRINETFIYGPVWVEARIWV